MDVRRIAVVGNGLMGKGIAHVFAAKGYKVDLFGRRDDIREEMIAYFDHDIAKGRLKIEERDDILGNIDFHNIITEANFLERSEFIVETVKEDLGIKKEILEIIDQYAKEEAIIASNTSSYSITRLAQFTSKPENFLGVHFFSPVPLMKLVEVVKGEASNSEIIERVCDLINAIDKMPIKVKDSPGFVLNRGLFN